MTTTALPPTTSTAVTALAVGIHRDHGHNRLLLRMPGGHRAVSLPLTARDTGLVLVPESTARPEHSLVRWFTPPVSVRVRAAPDGRGIVFAGRAAPSPATADRSGGAP
ncbi:hypothetical protein [Kitasatospora sp. NPDC050463]|uniref:hypothetical protein n=1 Tax=Kitasatospora sp. NPDC050463 TaxID=3155786 RepID=UPI0033FA4178